MHNEGELQIFRSPLGTCTHVIWRDDDSAIRLSLLASHMSWLTFLQHRGGSQALFVEWVRKKPIPVMLRL